MKWIWLLLLVFYCGPNDSTSSEIDIETLLLPTKNTRSARTLEFSSEEQDENGIHLHIWNDMNNKKNFYPNLLQQIAEESVKSDTDPASTVPDESDSNSSPTHIHFNLNEVMPTPQPQVSAANLLKNALVHTLALDEFRKSDQNLYGSFYKLKANSNYKPNTINWNYHPSAVNYIPKPYNTNLNGAPIKFPKPSPAAKTTMSRPTLREQMRATRNFVQDYYTNLHKTRPKSVIQAVGYEIGGMPKYSGRLLANEPMPQQYRTFKMFEPKPPQIMLPPPDFRIPEFKPVPPRLKIIPVIDEILDSGNQLAEQNVKPNYPLMPVMPKQLQIIPFKLSEAITMAPFPKTEYNHIGPPSEANQNSLHSPDIETLQSIRAAQNQIASSTTTTAPRYIGYLPNQQPNYSIPMREQFPNDQYKTDAVDAKLQMPFDEYNDQYSSSDYSSGIVGTKISVSLENSRSNFTDRTQLTNQQLNDIDAVHAAKKNFNKKTKTMRKPQQPSSTDDRSITGFHKTNNDDDCNSKSGSTQNDTIKIECNTIMNALRSGTSINDRRNVFIDSVPSNTIQLSQTYSRQRQHRPTSSPLLLPMPSTKKEQDDIIQRQVLVNDINKALQTTLANDTNDHDASAAHDPFLIAVFDENDRAMRDDTDVNDDLQLAETATKPSNLMETGRNTNNSSIQRMDQKWATDRRVDTGVWSTDDRIQSKANAKTKIKTKSESNSINNTKQKDLKFLVNKSNGSSSSSSNYTTSSSKKLIDEKYFKWFNDYRNENRKLGRTIISEHFKKVKIEPNISWIVLPRKNSTESSPTAKLTAETIQYH